MVYQTQEMLAKETINRLKTAGADTLCLWLHTSQLNAENKNPNKLNMIAHLLEPLSQTTICRQFFLQSGDILLIGTLDLETLVTPHIERIRCVLNDDAFVQTAGNDFFTAYPILTHSDLLISALSSVSSDIPTVDAHTLWEQITPKMETTPLTDVMSCDTVLCLTPQSRQTICKMFLPDIAKMAGQLHIPTATLTGTVKLGCIRQMFSRNSDLFEYYNTNVLPSFIYFNAFDITKAGFDLFMQARSQKTVVCLSAEEMLSDFSSFASAIKKLNANRVSWALVFLYGENLGLVDFSRIKPEWICVPYCKKLLETLPAGLKKNNVILTHIDTDNALLETLKQGYRYFCGKVVNLILGAACQQHCPYGDTCATDLCRRIWTQKAPQKQCVFEEFRTRFILNETESA